MRKLASVRTVSEVKSIEKSDFLSAYKVNGWWVVDKKDSYKVGDKVVYLEIDSFLPIKPEYEFLRKSSYKKLEDGTEGFRLKSIKLRGQLSQGLILPCEEDLEVGTDVTEKLGITKYEPPIQAQLSGKIQGPFPSFIPKTDEERIQNLEVDLGKKMVYITEKLDGTSFTCYVKDRRFGVCSRNWELKGDDTSYWRASKKLDLKSKLFSIGDNIALQGELIGHGIQGNPYKLKDIDVYFFNGYMIDEGRRLSLPELELVLSVLNLNIVPILHKLYQLPGDNVIEHMLEYSVGKSLLNGDTDREGVVFRVWSNPDISYKAINNNYLLKHDN